MKEIYIKAKAKVNLTLEVLNKREDGYHNIKSIFQALSLHDDLKIEKIDDDVFELDTNVEKINNNQNIVYKAYTALKERFESITGVKVTLEKKVPMQAGLGGGSADCAAFLLAMNRLFELGLSMEELKEIGKKLGADVVPCLYDHAVIAEGIGDEITEIDTDFEYDIVIIKPVISCNTKEMYEKLDCMEKTKESCGTDMVVQALKEHNVKQIAENLYNDFEIAMQDSTLIRRIKEEFSANGALGSLMTGSGSCVFGIFEDKETALSAYDALKNKYETYICTSCNA
ncbi:MAG: 4-(cytidine 5'-diphospho)-2-C-methyl-D-erythritol kinase [Eubacteriales bacterium]|nr:4-(cytidine 5'-diphospho)-2-C-methyl-D-erythritol kinase [Eubacteriales bacterium]